MNKHVDVKNEEEKSIAENEKNIEATKERKRRACTLCAVCKRKKKRKAVKKKAVGLKVKNVLTAAWLLAENGWRQHGGLNEGRKRL